MAAQIWYENDGDLSVLEGKKVAIIGYGSKREHHSLKIAAKPPPSLLIPHSSFLIRAELPSRVKGRPAHGLTPPRSHKKLPTARTLSLML